MASRNLEGVDHRIAPGATWRAAVAVLLLTPLVLLAAMFAWLAVAQGTWRLWSVVVHEDGRRTFADTLFYFRHFLREVPVTALYAAMSAAALWTYGPATRSSPSAAAVRAWAGAAALALVVIAAVAAAYQSGAETALWDLLQAYLRDDEWAHGSHWRAHVLSSWGYLAAAVVAAVALGPLLGGGYVRPRPIRRARGIGGCVAALVLLTVLCGPSWQPVSDARTIGHAARELATHVLITLPLSFGILLGLSRPPPADAGGAAARPPPDVIAALAIGLVVALFLVASTLATGAVGAARPAIPASSLVAAHAFEHALDYLWLALLCTWLAGLKRGISRGGTEPRRIHGRARGRKVISVLAFDGAQSMMTRRAFTALASLAGLGALVPPEALPRAIRRLALPPANAREPLLMRIVAVVAKLDRGELSPEAFVREVQARFAETALPAELHAELAAPPPGNAVHVVWSSSEGDRQRMLMLFFIPPATAVPAHAHHDVASAQCVVRGRVRVRQYERVRRIDPHTLGLRPVTDRVLVPGQAILTTERLDNVHWFGAETEPAVVINYALNGGFRDTFDPPGSRPVGRYYVDPTTADHIDGLIAAPELAAEAAHAQFAGHALSEFASPLAMGTV